MRNDRPAPLWLLSWLLLMPLLPACSLIPSQQPVLEGFPPDTVQQIRQQSAELDQLQDLEVVTPTQQQRIQHLKSSLKQFERDIISKADRLEKQDNWHSAGQMFQDATRIFPDSQVLLSAQQNFEQRRQLREERVRMELEIHRGEQLVKDVEAYQRLRQLKGPGLMTWLELKNFHRKRRASAETLMEYAQRALAREDYSTARRALKVAQGLYGDDLQQESDLREILNRNLTQANLHLRQATSKKKPESVRKNPNLENQADITALKQALASGDLATALNHLNRLQQRSPKSPQLPPLQAQLQKQLNEEVGAAIKRGNDLYSQGKIEQALTVWREAKNLAPSNVELLGNIVRAEKVLENLRALTPSSAPTNPRLQ